MDKFFTAAEAAAEANTEQAYINQQQQAEHDAMMFAYRVADNGGFDIGDYGITAEDIDY